MQSLGELRTFVSTTFCRWRMFLSHFGEIPPPSNPTYGIDGCGRCDNCNLSPEEVSSGQEDFGKEARLLLSVVDALRGSYGITMYVEILRGKVGWGPLPMVNAFSFPVSLNTHKQPPPPFCTFPKLLPSSGCKETAEGCQLGTAGRSVRSRRKSSKHSRKFLSPVSTAHPLGGGAQKLRTEKWWKAFARTLLSSPVGLLSPLPSASAATHSPCSLQAMLEERAKTRGRHAYALTSLSLEGRRWLSCNKSIPNPSLMVSMNKELRLESRVGAARASQAGSFSAMHRPAPADVAPGDGEQIDDTGLQRLEKQLYDELTHWRQKLAGARGMPAVRIFTNQAIATMATQRFVFLGDGNRYSAFWLIIFISFSPLQGQRRWLSWARWRASPNTKFACMANWFWVRLEPLLVRRTFLK